jgi:hypothetical protein
MHRRHSTRRSCIALLGWALGCGDDGMAADGSSSTGSATTEGSSTTEDITSTSSASSSGVLPPGAPPECDGLSSPFTSAECLSGLRDRCRAATSESDCDALDLLVFEDGGYLISCGWAKVVAFSDIDACTIASVGDRCEAGIQQDIGCGDKCTDTPDLYASLKAIIADNELIEMPCTDDGLVLDGPLGPSSAVGAPPGETGTCAPDIVPPAPAICTCAADACAAS